MSAGHGSIGSVDDVDVDVVVVGAGFAGLYMLYRLRELGLSATVVESAGDVGGTWYWNRYPGARCDIPTTDYTYSFDAELEDEWTWSEKYATQPEILRYLQRVADKHDLRGDIRLSTRVDAATWDDARSRWLITTDRSDQIACRHLVMATGCLSIPKDVDIDGLDRFTGGVYFTSTWPHETVDLHGKRIGVIGTGSTGIQCIPLIAEQAAELVVFQRTPNFSLPARNGPPSPRRLDDIARDREAYRHAARWSPGGMPARMASEPAASLSADEQQARFEAAWDAGELFAAVGSFADVLTDRAANEVIAEGVRRKIREIVHDPRTAEALSPRDHPFGTKRPCLDTGYYATFNLPHVRLVDLRQHPISTITTTGIDTIDESFELDALVLATGFDAMTGAIVAVDITGRDGATLTGKWAHGPTTYLGLTTTGFPNLFMITGPGSPSVLSNMAVSIEQHVDWVADCLEHMRANGFERIEPTATAEAGWVEHVNACADATLYPVADSWYMGANVLGKPRVFLPYIGGVNTYRAVCDEVAANSYLGFELTGPGGTQRNDGVIR